jgi:hypothetical protein
MNKELQREQTLLSKKVKLSLHNTCEVEFKIKGPNIGMYCANKSCYRPGEWIQWIKHEQVRNLLKKDK